ncbi:MAG: hypothetical protein ACYSTI_13395 [Planctomycetota bacterium]
MRKVTCEKPDCKGFFSFYDWDEQIGFCGYCGGKLAPVDKCDWCQKPCQELFTLKDLPGVSAGRIPVGLTWDDCGKVFCSQECKKTWLRGKFVISDKQVIRCDACTGKCTDKVLALQNWIGLRETLKRKRFCSEKCKETTLIKEIVELEAKVALMCREVKS